MNEHERCLGAAEDAFTGALDPAARAAFEAHRAACPDCRALLERWDPQAPVPSLAAAVLARLDLAGARTGARPSPAPARTWGPAWAAAALLLGACLGSLGTKLALGRTPADPAQALAAQIGSELSLNGAQRRAVARVLANDKALMEWRRRTWDGDVQELGREGEASIAGLLDPGQERAFSARRDGIHAGIERYLWQDEAVPAAAPARADGIQGPA